MIITPNPSDPEVQILCNEFKKKSYNVEFFIPSTMKVMVSFKEKFEEKFENLEYLIVPEGDDFSFTGNLENDLLSITAVHPMNENAVTRFLSESGKNWTYIQKMIDRGQLAQVDYKGTKYYLRCFR